MATSLQTRSAAPGAAVIAAGTALVVLAAVIAATVSWRQAGILLVGAGLGVALYHGAMGFTAYWRRWLVNREGFGVRMQLWIIGLGSLAFFPMIGGWLPGFEARGAVAPLGLEVAIGACLFGVGMQLANGCGSGTLFTLGGGSTKMLLTLAAFIAGSLLATFHLHLWRPLPELPAVSLVNEFGVGGGLLAQAFILLMLLALVRRYERKPAIPPSAASGDALRGPWPPLVAATVLAALAVVMFWLAGLPWSVTFAFALWGGQLYEAVGGDLSTVPFWSVAWAQTALDVSVLRNATSVSNFGVILGALLAAGLANRFNPARSVPWRPGLAALIGGLIMGYGARLAYGCNVGAFVGGTMSGSLHGWLWLAAALVGCWIGIRLRPLFALANEPPRA